MSRSISFAAVLAMVALVGCTKTEKGGGIGDDTFKLTVPATSVDVKQGEMQTTNITVTRGDGFKQDLKLELKAPKGLDVEPDSTTVKASDKGEVQVKIAADKDAPLGEHKIMIKGTPDKGQPADLEMKVNVKSK
jgi:uncharacterized membrane protein